MISFEKNRRVSNRFVRACAEGRIDDVMIMIEDGEDLDQFDEGFKSEGPPEIQSTDGNLPNSFMQNGIQMAIRTKNLDLFCLLIQSGAKLDFPIDDRTQPAIKNSDGEYERPKVPFDPVADCAHYGFVDGLHYLLNETEYTLPTDKDKRGEMVIDAVEANSMELLAFLVDEHGFDPAYVSERNERALTSATNREIDNAILEYLLKKGISPNYHARIKPRYTVTYADSFKDDVDEQFDGGFSTFERIRRVMNKHQGTPLNWSVFLIHTNEENRRKVAIEKVSLLLKYGADPFFADENGITAFDFFSDEDAKELGFIDDEVAGIFHLLTAAVSKQRQNKPQLDMG